MIVSEFASLWIQFFNGPIAGRCPDIFIVINKKRRKLITADTLRVFVIVFVSSKYFRAQIKFAKSVYGSYPQTTFPVSLQAANGIIAKTVMIRLMIPCFN